MMSKRSGALLLDQRIRREGENSTVSSNGQGRKGSHWITMATCIIKVGREKPRVVPGRKRLDLRQGSRFSSTLIGRNSKAGIRLSSWVSFRSDISHVVPVVSSIIAKWQARSHWRSITNGSGLASVFQTCSFSFLYVQCRQQLSRILAQST